MGQTIIDEETKIESQTWSAPANFELPTKFEDTLTDELTDEKDNELINEQKDTNLIQEKEIMQETMQSIHQRILIPMQNQI